MIFSITKLLITSKVFSRRLITLQVFKKFPNKRKRHSAYVWNLATGQPSLEQPACLTENHSSYLIDYQQLTYVSDLICVDQRMKTAKSPLRCPPALSGTTHNPAFFTGNFWQTGFPTLLSALPSRMMPLPRPCPTIRVCDEAAPNNQIKGTSRYLYGY